MYLHRKADDFLLNWKANPNRLPLIVRGARQVGKTATIRQFAQNNYAVTNEINFVAQPHLKAIINEGFSVNSIVKLLSRMEPHCRFSPGQTLLFLDEIQDFPEITTALKFFKEDGRYDVICSGSLLGIQHNRIHSHSVGYKSDYDMHSLDFEEFLLAIGYPEDTITSMLEHMLTGKPFPPQELERYFSLFMDYIVLGGMPAIIADFVQTGTFEHTMDRQRQLVLDYREDIRKYAEGLDQAKITAVFDSIVPQLAKENKKFQFSKVAKNARTREYYGCVEWLLDAGVINISHCLNFPELPLGGNFDPQKYKLYMADTGLLLAMLDEEAVNDLRQNQNLGIYKGALYENFAAEAFTKAGYNLYYYRSEDSSLEEDFFVRTTDSLIPIEIKAGNNISKSLRTLITSDRYPDIHQGIKFARANIGFSDALITFPYFCCFLLKRYLEHI